MDRLSSKLRSKASIFPDGVIFMTSGFKFSKQTTKSSKKLSIANATALTEKMELVFSEIEDPRVERT